MSGKSWRKLAYCFQHEVNPAIFEDPGDVDTAKAYCQRCVVSDRCLEFALSERDAEGVWGGTTEAERTSLKRGGHRASCPGCGGRQIYSDGASEICIKCGFAWKS